MRLKLYICLLTLVVQALSAKQPNILFIFADDHAYDAVGAHGNSVIKTPNLDRLSERGTHFSHAYNSGAWGGAVCVASRTMLQTGRQVWNARKASLDELLERGEFFPQQMRSAGYETYFAGKWHVGKTKLAAAAWKHVRNVRPGMPKQVKERYQRNFTPGQDSWDPVDTANGGFWAGGKHWSEVLADDGIEFIQQAADQDKPFMMMLCFNAPHDPRQAPQAYQEMYPYDSIPLPQNFLTEYPYEIGSNQVRDEKLGPFPRTPYSIQVNLSEYYALVTHMDDQIGRILEALEQSGLAEDTVIIFSADHGLGVGQHGLLGKQNMYDHSLRVPWIIAGPEIPKGKTISQPIYLQDAMATCLELAGASIPDSVEFQSVLPLIRGELSSARTAVYSCYTYHQRAVTDGHYKLIVYPMIHTELLFDLSKDPLETTNLAGNPEYQTVLEKARAQLKNQMLLMNDPLDLDDPVASAKAFEKSKRKAKH